MFWSHLLQSEMVPELICATQRISSSFKPWIMRCFMGENALKLIFAHNWIRFRINFKNVIASSPENTICFVLQVLQDVGTFIFIHSFYWQIFHLIRSEYYHLAICHRQCAQSLNHLRAYIISIQTQNKLRCAPTKTRKSCRWQKMYFSIDRRQISFIPLEFGPKKIKTEHNPFVQS